MAFPTGWTQTQALVIQHSLVAANQTHFPVLLTEASLPSAMMTSGGGTAAQSDGGDIRFSSDLSGATQLPCEVTQWTQNANPTLATAEIWVPVDVSSSVDVTIYVWWKAGGGITQPGAGTTFGAQAVWSNYFGVWHLSSASMLAESTTASAMLTNQNGVSSVTGKIDGGSGFAAASSQSLSNSSFNAPATVTLSAWVNLTTLPSAGNAYAVLEGWTDGNPGPTLIEVDSAGKLVCACSPTGTFKSYAGGTHTLSTGTWYYVAVTYSNATGLIGYVNGVLDGTAPSDGVLVSGSHLFEIGHRTNFGPHYLNGEVDEARVSNTVRSATWLLTEYNNQNAPGSFVVLGTVILNGIAAVTGAVATTMAILVPDITRVVGSIATAFKIVGAITVNGTASCVGAISAVFHPAALPGVANVNGVVTTVFYNRAGQQVSCISGPDTPVGAFNNAAH